MKYKAFKTFQNMLLVILFLVLGKIAFAQAPTITSFSPETGIAGTLVTINGNNFSPISSNNIVFFGGVKSVVTSSTINTLNVIVPKGVSNKPIMVVNNATRLTVKSTKSFKPQYTPINTSFSGKYIDTAVNYTVPDVNCSSYTVLGEPTDFDGDGKLDLILSESTVLFIRNYGTPEKLYFFDTTKISGGINGTKEVNIADFNGDGKLDILLTSYMSSDFTVLINKSLVGQIYFKRYDYLNVFTGNNNYIINTCVSDLNLDGKQDIIISNLIPHNYNMGSNTNSFNNNITIFQNLGGTDSISFTNKLEFFNQRFDFYKSTPYNYFLKTFNFSINDIDGDNAPDIFYDSNPTKTILRNNGIIDSFSFTQVANSFNCTPKIDFDGDGKNDAFEISSYYYNNFNRDTILIRKNNSTAGTISFATSFNIALDSLNYNKGIELGDMNGDGKVDIVIMFDNKIITLINNSTIGNINFLNKLTSLNNTSLTSFKIADMDLDGKQDLVLINSGIVIKRNCPFIAANLNSLSVNSGILSPVFSPNISNYNITLLNSVSSITFTPTITNIGSTVQININNNPFATVVSGSASLPLLLNIGNNLVNVKVTALDGTVQLYKINVARLGLAPTITSFSPLSDSVGAIITILGTNFSSNSADNIVIFGKTNGQVLSSTNTSITVKVPSGASYSFLTVINKQNSLSVNSKVQFSPKFSPLLDITNKANLKYREVNYKSNHYNYGFCTSADFDNDGKPDFAICQSSSFNFNKSTIQITKNISIGDSLILDEPLMLSILAPQYGTDLSMKIVDMDADGRLDIVVIASSYSISIIRNVSENGKIMFESPYQLFIPTFTCYDISFEILDINMDGLPEICLIDNQTIRIHKNISANGQIGFENNVNITVTNIGIFGGGGRNPNRFEIGDMNMDGKPDLLSLYGDKIYIYTNNSNLNNIAFNTPVFLSYDITVNKKNQRNIIIADMNLDGKPDILGKSTNIYNGKSSLAIFINSGSAGTLNFILNDSFTKSLNEMNIVNIADFSGDGLPDVIVTSQDSGICLVKNNSSMGNISFSNRIKLDSTQLAPLYYGNDIGDVNGDGRPDVLLWNKILVSEYLKPTNYITYSPSNIIALKSITNINIPPVYSGYSITNYSISPSLPNGVSLNTTTGVISGIPTVTIPQTTFTITGTNSGGSTTSSFRLTVNDTASNVVLNLKAMLQGLYLGNRKMIASPYSADGISPIRIADTIKVELRANTTPYNVIHTVKGLLDTSGNATITFPGSVNGNSYYVVVGHRNSIAVWSANPVAFGTNTNYDFTNAITKAFGSNMVEAGGVFMLFSGDINQDGSIDFADYPDFDISSGNADLGYLPYDLNGDGSVDFGDYPLIDINSSNGVIILTP